MLEVCSENDLNLLGFGLLGSSWGWGWGWSPEMRSLEALRATA
jgi:hypothetical protein